MTKPISILIIGSLPPFRSAAAALGLNTAEMLATSHSVTFVIDDLAPEPPVDLPFAIIRLRDLRANWPAYQDHKRLYIPGEGGDSLFPLEILRKAPGVVMPASLSLFPLAESTCRATDRWPNDYWAWLKQVAGEKAKLLYAARIHYRRESVAQAHVTPALDLLLAPATGLVAASPAMDRALQASGLEPDLSLNQPPAIAAQGNSKSASKTPTVLYVAEEAAPAQICSKALGVFGQFDEVSHLSIHPAARHLAASIAEADIVAFLDGLADACSPGLAIAQQLGKPIITAGQPWARHLPVDSHIALPHGKAFDTLATSVAALLGQPALFKQLAKPQQSSSTLDDIAACLQKTATRLADLAVPAVKEETTAPAKGEKVPKGIETAALIGAVPPNAILNELMPKLDTRRCPRFGTPALANRLASLTGEHPASLLARIGYEAPLVQDTNNEECHREPVSLSDLRQGLKAQTFISFGCSVPGSADGDLLLEGTGIAPKLAIRIGFDETDRNAPTQGFLTECGLLWSHDTVRHALQCVFVVGARGGTFHLKAGAPDAAYMVAGEGISTAISSGAGATLSSDALGLLEFRLMALDTAGGTPLGSVELRKQLANAGLILEWSAL